MNEKLAKVRVLEKNLQVKAGVSTILEMENEPLKWQRNAQMHSPMIHNEYFACLYITKMNLEMQEAHVILNITRCLFLVQTSWPNQILKRGKKEKDMEQVLEYQVKSAIKKIKNNKKKKS